MKTFIVIDTDAEFKNRFQKRLQCNKLDKKISLINISPDTSFGVDRIIEDVLEKVAKVITDENLSVAAFFVDIVVIEDGEIDNTGVYIANKLSEVYPHILTFNITGKHNFKQGLDIYSDAILENNDGVFSKYFLEGDYFNETRLNKILNIRESRRRESQPQIVLNNIFDVGILTALHDDEFENLKPLFDWKEKIEDETKIYHIGEIVTDNNSKVRIIATHQHKTGIVDAAVLATEMINKFSPKYLIMTGVCGGHGDDINFGDIVIASELFLHQKGKETDEGFQNEIDRCEIEHKLIHRITENKKPLLRLIKDGDRSRNHSNLKIHIKPMACGLSVINKNGYFEEKISSIDRNTIAVDMESFSVARACILSNDKKTKAIIVKSIMDKTTEKDDAAKPLAGYTSAQCALHLIKTVLFDTK